MERRNWTKVYLFTLAIAFIVFLQTVSFVQANIQGSVYSIPSSINDTSKPLADFTVKFYAQNNQTYETKTDSLGNFLLNTSKIFYGIENPDYFFKEVEFLDSKGNKVDTAPLDNNFTKNEYVSIDYRLPIKKVKTSFLFFTTSNWVSGIDYPAYQLYSTTPHDYTKIPLLLVHGWNNVAKNQSGDWGQLEDELNSLGYDVYKIQYWPANLSNTKNAGVIAYAINDIVRKGYFTKKVDVLAHSMGGLMVLGYTKNLGEGLNEQSISYQENIRNLVFVSSPLYGTYFANLVNNQFSFPMSCNLLDAFRVLIGIGQSNQISEATYDLEAGSNFTWLLNTLPSNQEIQYLSFFGRNLYPLCLINSQESNDGLVSFQNSYPNNLAKVITLNRVHTTINADARIAYFYDLLAKNQLTYANSRQLLFYDQGEFYYDPLNLLNSDPLPPLVNNRGSIILDLKKSQVDLSGKMISLKSSSPNYILTLNPRTNKYFFVNDTNLANMQFTTLLPVGSYALLVNGLNSGKIVKIDSGQVNFQTINFDEDGDGYDSTSIGGTDCNDQDLTIHPNAQELCDNLDNNCNNQIDEGFNIGSTCFGGIGNILQGQLKCNQNQRESICFNSQNNCVIPTNGMNITETTKLCYGNYSLLNGLNISAPNIILDCDNSLLIGNWSFGQSSYSSGINIIGKNVTVKNCVIQSYRDGIYSSNNDSVIVNNISNNQLSNNFWGMNLLGGNNVERNIFNKNLYGIGILYDPVARIPRVNYNDFENITYKFIDQGTIGSLNATLNWFGTTNESIISGKILGNVIWKPYLNNSIYFKESILPNATLNSPLNNTLFNSSSINFNYSVSDNIGLSNSTLHIINITGNDQKTNIQLYGALSSTLSMPVALVDGTYNWFVSVFDLAGNQYSTQNNTFLVDTIYPNVNVILPSGGFYNSSPINLTFTATDINLDKCWYSNNSGQTNVSIGCNKIITNLNLHEGLNVLTIYANDIVGHSSSNTTNIFLDTIKPIITNLKVNGIADFMGNQSVDNYLNISLNYSELNPKEISVICFYNFSDLSQDYFYIDTNLSSGNNIIWNHSINIASRPDGSKIDYCQILLKDKANNLVGWSKLGYFIINRTTYSCTPNVINSSSSPWENIGTCKIYDLQNQSRYFIQYDSNNCGTIANQTFYEYQESSCNYCSSNPANTSFGDWYNSTGCQANNTQVQERIKIEYDANYPTCYAITQLPLDLWNNGLNNTYFESQIVSCEYNANCTPNLMNTSWSSWNDAGVCNSQDKQNQTRSLTQYDSNNCGTEVNTTFYEYRQTDCNFCSENIQTLYTSWSSCSSSQQTRTKYFSDSNYNSCCIITVLSSDCEINNGNYIAATETQSCSSSSGGGGSGSHHSSSSSSSSRSSTSSNSEPVYDYTKNLPNQDQINLGSSSTITGKVTYGPMSSKGIMSITLGFLLLIFLFIVFKGRKSDVQ